MWKSRSPEVTPVEAQESYGVLCFPLPTFLTIMHNEFSLPKCRIQQNIRSPEIIKISITCTSTGSAGNLLISTFQVTLCSRRICIMCVCKLCRISGHKHVNNHYTACTSRWGTGDLEIVTLLVAYHSAYF